ncbi:MAG TPA: 5-methyltetrahydropteroyltriglutamate--homocysteine S-methyltransferase [Gammaproteobacteria bacterium]
MSSERRVPPFRADHVGSLLRPPNLLSAREDFRQGKLSADKLKAIEDEAIRDVVKLQEDVGLQSITDGEFRRNLWHVDFLKEFSNVTQVPSPVKVKFHTEEGDMEKSPNALRVTGKLTRPHAIQVEDFRFLKSVTKQTPKVMIPSPSILHFRGGRKAVDENAYPDMEGFFKDLTAAYRAEVKDLADAGCRYLQIDDVNFAYLCDPKFREQARGFGEDPDQLPHLYARLVNESIASRPKDMKVTMHLCRGNFESAWVAEGGYEPVAETMFNEADIDGFFLEYDTPRSGDFKPLRFVPKGKMVVLGLVTSKRGALEKKDDLKRRIDEAAKFVPLEQLALSPQCGFASGERGNKLTVEEEIAKLTLVVDVAREVWG